MRLRDGRRRRSIDPEERRDARHLLDAPATATTPVNSGTGSVGRACTGSGNAVMTGAGHFEISRILKKWYLTEFVALQCAQI